MLRMHPLKRIRTLYAGAIVKVARNRNRVSSAEPQPRRNTRK